MCHGVFKDIFINEGLMKIFILIIYQLNICNRLRVKEIEGLGKATNVLGFSGDKKTCPSEVYLE